MRLRYPLVTFTTILFALTLCAGACAPKVTFFVTRPPELPIEAVENIVIGDFVDTLGEPIPLPNGISQVQPVTAGHLQPTIADFLANRSSAELIRGLLVAELSLSGQYRLLNTGGADVLISGVLPSAERTGVISARVRFFDFTADESEQLFYLLLATQGGLDLRGQAMLVAAKAGVVAAAKANRKGFMVDTPYHERVSAMEVEFDLIRQNSGEKIVDTQRFRGYFTQKWGGNPDTSHLPTALRQVIIERYQKNESLIDLFQGEAANLQLALMDPDEFLARGGKLQNDPTVPANMLDIQLALGNEIVQQYIRLISQTTEETVLDVASGDAIAVNLIRGNAYEQAINRLENIQRTEADSYNLALAYESIAEFNQAARYYQEALDRNPRNTTYLEALRRVKR
jgi:tetratricopeptide (TPR) repeat protein